MFQATNEQIVTGQYISADAAATARTVPFFMTPRAATIVRAVAAVATGVTTANSTSYFALSLIAGGTVGTSTLTICTFGSAATPFN